MRFLYLFGMMEFDIELVNVDDIDLEILESEYVVIDGIEFPVSRYGEDDTEYWYL